MKEMIRITGLARHPDAIEHIIDLIKNSRRYENVEFNARAHDLLDAWRKETSENPILESRLHIMAGVGVLGVASTVQYDATDKKIIHKVDVVPGAIPTFSDLAKTVLEDSLGQEIPGIVFGNEGETPEALRNGVWIPENYAGNLSLHVLVSTKNKE